MIILENGHKVDTNLGYYIGSKKMIYLGGFFMSEITQVISSLGFPIFMAIMVFWYMATTYKKHTDKMVSELSLLNKAIMENTNALRTVVSRLSELEHGVDDLEREVERGHRKD